MYIIDTDKNQIFPVRSKHQRNNLKRHRRDVESNEVK